MLAVTLESRAVERLLVVGVSDADDQPRALLKRASVQVHGSVLGNEPVDVRARRDDAGSERQLGAILLMPLFVVEGMARIALPPSEREAP